MRQVTTNHPEGVANERIDTMGIFDKAKDALNGGEGSSADKARDAINQHEAKIDQGIDKAGDAVDGRTGGQYADKVDQGQDFLKDKTGNL
ncbi:antitoxin [Luteococcus sp. Sow4_B9]|uniref:antitoxin n=1 Tax=Luteococcus sp. Sow4_B9 TaxID=3438792 RepID=UPI003F9598BD